MASISLLRRSCVVVAVDIQDRFLLSIDEAERVLTRSKFLCRAAQVLDVPVIGTLQNPEKLGVLPPELSGVIQAPISKMSFSCWGSERFRSHLDALGRTQVVLVGVETHICVCLTALDLLRAGYEVAVCPDAVSSSSLDRHKLGMERMRDAGVTPIHSEAAAYEWMGTAQDPKFRELLEVVKSLSR